MSKLTIEVTTPLQLVHASRLIIATNRGPVEYFASQNNGLRYRRVADGIATALVEGGNGMNLIWVALAMTDGDRKIVKTAQRNGGLLRSPLYEHTMQLLYVAIPKVNFRKHYEKMSNQLLWFLQHHMHDSINKSISSDWIQDVWTNGYCVANQAIANAINAEVDREPSSVVVMLHDYHLYLVPLMIRTSHPSIIVQHFIHIPWPDIRYWHFLPSNIVQAIYSGLMGNDIISFQTELDARNFIEGAARTLESISVDFAEGTILWQGRHIQVRTYPISISVVGERRIVESPVGKQAADMILPLLNEHTIMRVDRIEPTKNIVQGFQAYAQMLDEHPSLLGRVTFLAFLVPSRQTLLIYRHYQADVLKIIEEINQRFGSEDWLPIRAFIGDDRIRALAAMQYYDVLLVNSLIDGMNLVSKEGPIVNKRNGVLVLSRTAGAFQQLSKASLPISPSDVSETAQALYQALTLSPEERRAMATLARQSVEQNNLDIWLTRQIYDINKLLDRS